MARRCNVDNVHPMDFSVVHGMDTGVLHQVTFPLKDPLKIKGKGEKSLLAAFALQREQLMSEMQSIWQEALSLMNDFGRRRYDHAAVMSICNRCAGRPGRTRTAFCAGVSTPLASKTVARCLSVPCVMCSMMPGTAVMSF